MRFRIANRLAMLTIAAGISLSAAETLTSTVQVKIVRVDMRLSPAGFPSGKDAAIKLTASDDTFYMYYYNSGDLVSVAKANQFLAMLLTAKSTGAGVQVFWYAGSSSTPSCLDGFNCFTLLDLQ